jgi:hypothetical protein
MERFDLDKFKIEPHHIVFAWTSHPDYEMCRLILLEIEYEKFVVLEGSHCSCYDFNDTSWDAVEYAEDELKKLAKIKSVENDFYYGEHEFWKKVADFL